MRCEERGGGGHVSPPRLAWSLHLLAAAGHSRLAPLWGPATCCLLRDQSGSQYPPVVDFLAFSLWSGLLVASESGWLSKLGKVPGYLFNLFILIFSFFGFPQSVSTAQAFCESPGVRVISCCQRKYPNSGAEVILLRDFEEGDLQSIMAVTMAVLDHVGCRAQKGVDWSSKCIRFFFVFSCFARGQRVCFSKQRLICTLQVTCTEGFRIHKRQNLLICPLEGQASRVRSQMNAILAPFA